MAGPNGSTPDASPHGNPSAERPDPSAHAATVTAAGTPPLEKPRNLGDLLFADCSNVRIPESEWVAIVRAVAKRDQAALRALYERSHRLVFTLIMRIVNNRETAEELTVDVFHDAWRRAPQYDPANGPVLGWIMNQARSRAIDRIRYELRLKRAVPATLGLPADAASDSLEQACRQELARRLRIAVAGLDKREREAIEAAYFSELTHAEVKTRLGQPLGTIKTRIRSGLHKLRARLAPDREDL